jgi:hypothetical protein
MRAIAAVAVPGLMGASRMADRPAEIEEEMEGYEGGFQLSGLS